MVADAYPPMRTSCAVQMYDLGQALLLLGHKVTMINPISGLSKTVQTQNHAGVHLVQVRAFETKDVPYIQRVLAEFINPWVIWHHLKNNKEFNEIQYNGVVWYSPTIFWGPLINRLKQHFKIPSYLILRDIFPDWAIDLKILKKGPTYLFLKAVECYQYLQANSIGLQSPNNLKYFIQKHPHLKEKCQVLWNWGGKNVHVESCAIDISKTSLAGKVLCVYAGNMGKAQGMDSLLDLAGAVKHLVDIGFVLVGRGSEVTHLEGRINKEGLSNVLLFDEIESNNIPGLYAQCHVGIVTLDLRHKTHNIPGKWIGYLQVGLPTFALINPGNDMVKLISEHQIGFASSSQKLQEWVDGLIDLKQQIQNDDGLKIRSLEVSRNLFTSEIAANKIVVQFYSKDQ